MSIITKILELLGIYQQAQNNIPERNDHNTDSDKVERIQLFADTEAVEGEVNLEYPLLILREKALKCTYEASTRNEQGVMEDFFFDYLSRAFPNITDNAISIQTDTFSLTPDLVLIDESNNIFIAIEIDEPYSIDNGGVLIPIHTIGSDDARNKHFSTRGWSVIRFAEEQIAKHPEKCIEVVRHFVNTGDLLKTNSIKCWTREDSGLMIANFYRDTYLPFPFEGTKTALTKSSASYRSFEITSISKRQKNNDKYIVLRLKYPHFISETGEITLIGHEPQQCWVIEEVFWQCIYQSGIGKMIKEFDLDDVSIGMCINSSFGQIMLECYGKINNEYFNIYNNKLDIIFSDTFLIAFKNYWLEIINPIRKKYGRPLL